MTRSIYSHLSQRAAGGIGRCCGRVQDEIASQLRAVRDMGDDQQRQVRSKTPTRVHCYQWTWAERELVAPRFRYRLDGRGTVAMDRGYPRRATEKMAQRFHC